MHGIIAGERNQTTRSKKTTTQKQKQKQQRISNDKMTSGSWIKQHWMATNTCAKCSPIFGDFKI